MIARITGLFGSLPAPRSLRKQLLVISLLILSGLLLFIGVLQSVLMRDFIYSTRAESREGQVRSVPGEIFSSAPAWGAGGMDASGMSGGEAGSPDTGSPGNPPPGNLRNTGRRPLLLDAHTTIAVYSADRGFKDFQEETLSDSPAPRLTDAEYNDLLKHTTDKAKGGYRLMAGPDGSEHLAGFMNRGKPQEARMLLQMSVSTGTLKDVIM
ncbi:hypothetical protein AMQ83_10960 [Paenibacillus riograndensis]|nr:hypothetical protein AMQ83_10960 [Paenibacillus riograndensis]